MGRLAGAFKTDPGVDCVRLHVNGDGLKKGEKYVCLDESSAFP